MFRIGSTIRSAKRKLTTPPKLMPPFQRTAASGTFPTEQTNDETATTGPISGPHSFASDGWVCRKRELQASVGTNAAITPASKRPCATPVQIETQFSTQ